MAERIPDGEVTFDPHSFRDKAGRVFRWRGQLYRGISASFGPTLTRLFRDGTIERLVDLGLLVETEMTELELDGYEQVVRHRAVPFVSYPPEWSAAMMRDAALLTLRLVEELAAVGLTLRDSHPWNVLFEGPRPVHIDLTSITTLGKDGNWTGYNSFCRNLLHPLVLMAHGRDEWARWLMNTDRGAWRRDVIALAPAAAAPMLMDFARDRWRFRRSGDGPGALRALLERLRSKVERTSVADSPRGVSGRQSSADGDMSGAERRVLEETVAKLQPESVLSIDSRPRGYPKLLARSCGRVVAFDTHLQSITQLYGEARSENLPILPLVMDFTKPTPAYGLFDHHFVAATQRFRCDMVVAPRLVRSLQCPNRRLDCEQIIDGLALFSRRWILIGYVPPGARTDGSEPPDASRYDSLESFARTLRRRLGTVDVIPFEGTAGALLVCEK